MIIQLLKKIFAPFNVPHRRHDTGRWTPKIISVHPLQQELSRLTRIRIMAEQNGLEEISHQENIGLVSFSKGDVRINVYYTKMTVGTCIKHPTKGKTQLFRRNVPFTLLEKILRNPRVHTGKGYY